MASYASVGEFDLSRNRGDDRFRVTRVIKIRPRLICRPISNGGISLDRGLIDAIVSRKEMKQQLIDTSVS